MPTVHVVTDNSNSTARSRLVGGVVKSLQARVFKTVTAACGKFLHRHVIGLRFTGWLLKPGTGRNTGGTFRVLLKPGTAGWNSELDCMLKLKATIP